MQRIVSGVRADRIDGVVWRKSRYSGPGGNCVELAALPGGKAVAVRDSWCPGGPALVWGRAAVDRFLRSVASGKPAAPAG